jgi:hypothetical protein
MLGKWIGRIGLLAAFGAAVFTQPSAAHVGALPRSVAASAPVPTWLLILTGGVVVGASFMFLSILTGNATVHAINEWGVPVPTPSTVRRTVGGTFRAMSIGGLLLVLVTGLTGPRTSTSNAAILVVWVGWWAGYSMSVYLIGNTWPLLNPWRALADLLPTDRRLEYPEWLGAWPSIIGLLGLVWLEVVSPVAQEPDVLAFLIIGYSIVTLAGAWLFGVEAWFGTVDPISRVFRCYGRMAPFQRTASGVEFKLPGAALTDRLVPMRVDETAFIVALLWATTYDGLVSTPLWSAVARPVVSRGVPASFLYLATIVVGFLFFFSIYRAASRLARRTGRTFVTPGFIEGWFAPSLIPIAAGYHLAHFLGYFLTQAPALLTVINQPFSPPTSVPVLLIPSWFPTAQILFVLLGHLIAVWVAHTLAYDLFPGRLKPIRSQYPFVVVMIFYTMTSMWVVTRPFAPPP